ncbi:PQQ-binding-like beta-propeller repeat protein [Streptomyces syringium]|uniref:protein kinase domain-containing protein n=1 Tax=Streptomyces syringium TaxID=76729 RepID=UPI0036E787FC
MPFPLTHDDPHHIGPYRLIARLGSGGMGTVYLARSAGGRTVALKTMHAAIASDTTCRTRFRLESDAARVIGGLHGAEVVDADPRAETPWLATEYVLGPPLDEAVRLAGPLPEPSVRALGAALCGALGQLHGSDVVHRDLKPSNIMITAYGPKVIDFGIARAIGDDRLTRTGAAAGTPAFMSPEQVTGGEHSPAGDVFALAGVLVFAATGHGPFGNGQSADLLYRVRYEAPDLTGVPAALAPLLSRCLSKNPDERLTTAELAAALHDGDGQFADHLPDALLAEIARRATEVWTFRPERLPAPYDLPEEPSRTPGTTVALSRRRLLTLAGGSALGVAAAGAGTWAWLGRDDPDPGPAPYKKPDPGPSANDLPRQKHDSVWQIQVAGPPDHMVPAEPLVAGDRVFLVASAGLAGIDAKTGAVEWASQKMERTWQTVSDGTHVYRLVELDESEGHKGRHWPLIIASVDLATGKAKEPFARYEDYNGVIYENQLLCVADGVVYLAVGEGEYSMDGFLSAQTWSLLAVAVDSGRKIWTQPLPTRPDKADRLHFLAARAVGDRLVLFQETNDGKVRLVVRDTRTGKPVWDKPLDGAKADPLRVPPAVDGNHVYLGLGQLRALRLRDGSQAWKGTGRRYGPPALKDGVVYAVEEGRGVVAVDAASGKPRWEEKSGEGAAAALVDPPVIGPKYVYSKGTSGLRAIDPASRTTVRGYRTTGERFIAHERAETVVALGGRFLAAFPLE